MISLAPGHAYKLTSVEGGVRFDIDGRGLPDRVAWTAPGSLVAFLVRDLNGNGAVDSGAEMFGTATRKRNGTKAIHGFDALADLDGEQGVPDGHLSEHDPSFGMLRPWLDTNHDGISQTNELTPLSSHGITAIGTTSSPHRRRDGHGNTYRYQGWVTLDKSGSGRRRIFDVYLVTDRRY